MAQAGRLSNERLTGRRPSGYQPSPRASFFGYSAINNRSVNVGERSNETLKRLRQFAGGLPWGMVPNTGHH